MSKTDIKKGDEVVVISGAEKGKRGKVVSYNRADERLTIEGLNLVKRRPARPGCASGGASRGSGPRW